MGIGSALGALGSLGAGLFTSNAASQAAQTQANAAQQALLFQTQAYNKGQRNLSPYMATGSGAANMLTQQLPQLTKQFNPTEAQLAATPGYQFDLSQGLQATQNSAAARGLGVSGAAQKGAANYATGLADNTLQTQFNIDQQNKTNAYNKLVGTSQLGSGAAGTGAYVGSQAGTSIANTGLTGAQGQATAQNTMGTAFNPFFNNLGNYYTQNKLGGLYTSNGNNLGAAVGGIQGGLTVNPDGSIS